MHAAWAVGDLIPFCQREGQPALYPLLAQGLKNQLFCRVPILPYAEMDGSYESQGDMSSMCSHTVLDVPLIAIGYADAFETRS